MKAPSCCSKLTNSIGTGGSFNWFGRRSLTTPMTSKTGTESKPKRRPTAFSVSKNRRASDSEMIATFGALRPSVTAKSRPLRSRIPVVERNPAVTSLTWTLSSHPAGLTLPGTAIELLRLALPASPMEDRAADLTPGTAATIASIRR